MTGLILGLDIDEVSLEFITDFLIFHNDKYGTNLSKEDIVNFNFNNQLGCTFPEAWERVLEFYETPLSRRVMPVLGAQQGIAELKKYFDKIYGLTARPEEMKERTSASIDYIFSGEFDDIKYSDFYNPEKTKTTKDEWCKIIPIDVLVEDRVKYAIKCAKTGTKVFLFDQPWNQDDKMRHFLKDEMEIYNAITRVYGWSHAVPRIKEHIKQLQ
ncbi:hypothetical protein HQ529_04380 [Candidatus Woesearchaeota archaeon]|nr:hypothetical protein [Candidatus Woesearchaeota archaeon]